MAHDGVFREPWASTAADNTPLIPTDVQRLLEIHLWDEDDALGTLCLANPTGAPHTWKVSRDLYDDMASSLPSFEPLQMIYRHLRLMETHVVIGVPPHTLGAPQVCYLEIKGPPPCPSPFEDFIHHYGTYGPLKASWRAPRHAWIII